jgi:hypothetical protein
MSEGDGWDQEAEHREADFLHMLERMEQDWFERGIESAEDAISRTFVSDFPLPNSAHPAIAEHAGFVRRFNGPTVRLPVIRRAGYMIDPGELYPTAALSEVLNLTRRKVAAPAPFTGDGYAIYVWAAWTDQYGRHITGDSALVWRPTS